MSLFTIFDIFLSILRESNVACRFKEMAMSPVINFQAGLLYGRLFVTLIKLKAYVYHSQNQDELSYFSNRNRQAR